MTQPVADDPRLARLAAICLSLPETTRHATGQHAKFQVRNKSFAYYFNDHHGDGIVALSCKVPSGVNAMMAAAEPQRFYLPAYLGANGWVGLRLDGGDIDWDEVVALISDSYRLIAPKRLAVLASALLP